MFDQQCLIVQPRSNLLEWFANWSREHFDFFVAQLMFYFLASISALFLLSNVSRSSAFSQKPVIKNMFVESQRISGYGRTMETSLDILTCVDRKSLFSHSDKYFTDSVGYSAVFRMLIGVQNTILLPFSGLGILLDILVYSCIYECIYVCIQGYVCLLNLSQLL